MNLYEQILDATSPLKVMHWHDLAKQCEMASQMLLYDQLRVLCDQAMEIYANAQLCLDEIAQAKDTTHDR